MPAPSRTRTDSCDGIDTRRSSWTPAPVRTPERSSKSCGLTPMPPIIVVSASVDQPYKIALLDAGADDYLTRPLDPEELLARVRAVSRRVPQLDDARPIVTADFTMHLADRRLFRTDKTEITLSPTEWRLIEVLARHSGHLVSREELLTSVWGPQAADKTAVPTGAHGEHPPEDRTGPVPASLLRHRSRPGTAVRPRGRTLGESGLRHAPRCLAALSTRMIVSRLGRDERRSASIAHAAITVA